MKIKRAINNILFGLVGQIIILGLGIIVPRLFILTFGSEVNGLLSSVSQVFIYLSLLEAGVGTATIQALYKPLASSDRDKINSILSATNKYYKRVGIYYILVVIVLSIFYPIVVKTSTDGLTVTSLILLIGMSGALNFFFQGKLKLLLQAEGKNYVLTNVTNIFQVITTTVKIFMILQGYNILMIHAIYLVINLFQMLIYYIYFHKYYKWLDFKSIPDKESIKQKDAVLIHQISSVVFYNTDVLLLTAFTNLKIVSVYMMYNTLLNMISMIISNFENGITFALGLTYYKDKNEYLKLNSAYEAYYLMLVFSLYLVAFVFISPFISLYTEGISDINYVDEYLPGLFILIKLLSSGRNSSGQIINITGHFKDTQYRSIFESVINIVVSIVCVIKFGMYGVLFGTIVALIYRTNDMIIFANKKILNRSVTKTYMRWLINLGLFVVLNEIIQRMELDNSNYFTLIVNAGSVAIIVLITFFVVNSIVWRSDFKYILNLIKDSNKKKFEE